MIVLVLLTIMVLVPTLPVNAVTIDHSPILIQTDRERVTFSLTVPRLPEAFLINQKHIEDFAIEYAFSITFCDGENIYEVATHSIKGPLKEKEVALSWMGGYLWYYDENDSFSIVTPCEVSADGNVISWALSLPVVDKEGSSVEIHFDNISTLGYSIYDSATDETASEFYRVLDDGAIEKMQENSFEDVFT